LLKNQIALENCRGLQEVFVEAYVGRSLVVGGFSGIARVGQVHSSGDRLFTNKVASIEKLVDQYKLPLALEEVKRLFASLLVIDSCDKKLALSSVKLAREYQIVMKMELGKQNQSPERQLELSAYMCLGQVSGNHQLLFLKNAMGQAYKLKCFIYSSLFAKRILSLVDVKL